MKLPPSFSIFPVKDKRPLVPWQEYQNRLATPEEIKKWEGMNKTHYGIATGPISKILVLDDDGGLDVKKYPVPKTWTVKTPRGGCHYYFRWVAHLDNKVTTKTEIMPKVDTRGQGGFVVFYGWQRPTYLQTLATPPQWLIDLLPNKYESRQVVSQPNKSQLQELLNGMDANSHNRNDSFARIAGSLRARGYASDDIFNLLIAKAREVGLGDDELKRTCDSICRYEPKLKVDENALSIDAFLNDVETVEWIVPGLIAKKSIGFIVGLPETGKTWAMIDLAIECAKGEGKWLGKFPVEKAKVMYIDQERHKSETQRRFKAVLQGADSTKTDLKNALYVKSGTTIRLNLQHSFDAFKKEVAELKPDLIIIDSFATIHTVEENSRQSIQAVLERIKEIRNEFGCTFLFIAHENKFAFDKESGDPSIAQMAGSIAIPAAAETVLTVRRQDAESSMIYHTKSTLAPTISPFLMKVTDANEAKTAIRVEAY